MSAPRKIWANVAVESNGTGLCGEWNHCDVGSTEDTLYHRDDVVRELRDQLAEMTRRRDEWRAKARGYDELRASVRKGINDAGDRNLSRVFLRGAMVELQAREQELIEALQRIGWHELTDREARDVARAALAKIAQEGKP